MTNEKRKGHTERKTKPQRFPRDATAALNAIGLVLAGIGVTFGAAWFLSSGIALGPNTHHGD